MWWRTLHSGLWYIIVVLFCHTNTLQTHTNKQTPTHTILAQPGMFASPCLHQVFTCVHQPFHLTWTSASSESDQDRTRIWSSAFLLWGIHNYPQYEVVQIRTDFPFNLGYVVAKCALPEYLLDLFYYQISQWMIYALYFSSFERQLSLWNKFLPRKRRLGGCSAHLATTVWFLLG